MANRRLSRSVALQTLFEWDFNGKVSLDQIVSILDRDIEEFANGTTDVPFMKELVEGIVKKQPDLDRIIEKAAPDWPLEKIANVDRNVLRIGLYELLFSDRDQVPPKVAINEAIELAKSFGGETSGKFVNGVLGAVYKELGEPGKDQESRKKKTEEVPYDEMEVEELVGAVVFARDMNAIYLAFVHDIFGHWTLSKGHTKEGETLEDAVKRKVREEIGIEATPAEKLGENEYVATKPDKTKFRKHVSYFLAEAKYEELTLGVSGGLDDCKWFKISEILDLNFYDDILPIVTKAIGLLAKIK
jgi:N utilization substance protein B